MRQAEANPATNPVQRPTASCTPFLRIYASAPRFPCRLLTEQTETFAKFPKIP
ncbi:hypothetical protein [Neisseria maigaei]|uniref:hypothetical protein n=1 Tax=Neisseria maigaei TaxID=2830651 RepID=UPI00265AEA03|nr:hypothetical protein [Neisseria maigaei]